MPTSGTHALTIEHADPDTLKLWPGNARRGVIEGIKESIRVNGFYTPLIVQKSTRQIIVGNHRFQAWRALAEEEPERFGDRVPAVFLDVNEARAQKINLADNKTADDASWDDEALVEQLQAIMADEGDLAGTGFADDEFEDLQELLADDLMLDDEPAEPGLRLSERFGAPPLSVLDARQGYWQDRKRAWTERGIASHEGRAEALIFKDASNLYANWYKVKNRVQERLGRTVSSAEVLEAPEAADLVRFAGDAKGTSVFDPALAEVLTSWFSRSGDRVLDPWAGGSVRGIVAALTGRSYTGVELSEAQVAANVAQWDSLTERRGDTPEWVIGDSLDVLRTMPAESADFVLACPPYYSLERYSDDPRDLSNMTPEQFDEAIAETVTELERIMRPDRYAAFVMGSVRGRDGHLMSMQRCFLAAAERAGLAYHQDFILVTQVGTAASRAARAFVGARTAARVHQEVMVLLKGDRKRAAARLEDEDIAASLAWMGGEESDDDQTS